MTKEKQFFLQVLRDFIHKSPTIVPEALDWQQLLTFASQHQLEGILYYQCKSKIPAPFSMRLSQLYASNLFFYSNRKQQLSEIAQKFSQEKIPYYTIKGFNISSFYPIPALRTMGDCDIVVHPEDKERAHHAMLALGFENRLKDRNEWTYFKKEMEYEIHDHLFYEAVFNDPRHNQYMDRAWEFTKQLGDSCVYELDWSFHYIFLLLHLKKHLLYSGVGFRQFMDLALAAQQADLDWQWLQNTLPELELLDFARVCGGFCHRWFGTEMPLAEDPADDFFESATEKIFSNGVFGYNNEKNFDNANLNQLQHFGKLKIALSRIFPPYKDVVQVPYYSFVKGKPWLLPCVWVYRLFRSLHYGKGADGVKLLDSALNSDKKLNEWQTEQQHWGL